MNSGDDFKDTLILGLTLFGLILLACGIGYLILSQNYWVTGGALILLLLYPQYQKLQKRAKELKD